jgi:hypothetical protein
MLGIGIEEPPLEALTAKGRDAAEGVAVGETAGPTIEESPPGRMMTLRRPASLKSVIALS